MKKTLLTLLLFCLLGLSASALPLKLRFRVVDDANNIMKGMTVRLYDRNDVIKEVENASSVTVFELTDATIYTIEVVLPGFVTKRVTVNTGLFDVEDPDKEGYRFEIILERNSNYRGMENADEVLDYPMAILELDTATGEFDYSKTYEESTQKAFEQLFRKGKDIKF